MRESAAIGALMNTRGLTELIVLNIGLELGLVSPTLFTMLVIMALVTTFMAGPALRLIDPQKLFSSPPEEEVREAMAEEGVEPRHSVVVSAQDGKNLDALLAIAEPLAATEPPRELIIARLVATQAIATGPASDERELRRATEEVNTRRDLLRERGIDARAVAFTTPDAGEDLVHLGSDQYVDLLLVDGRRPLLGPGVPAGEIGAALERAPCDVGVLVEGAGLPKIDAQDPVVVPFGGAEHDWAALELGSWIAAARGAPLKLLGASAENGEGRDASRLLANASLVVQQLAGITAEPVLTRPGEEVITSVRGRRPARRRTVRALARGRPRAGPGGDRQGRPRADPARPPRHEGRRTGSARRHDALQVVQSGLGSPRMKGVFAAVPRPPLELGRDRSAGSSSSSSSPRSAPRSPTSPTTTTSCPAAPRRPSSTRPSRSASPEAPSDRRSSSTSTKAA